MNIDESLALLRAHRDKQRQLADAAPELYEALKIARWYVERSAHITDLGALKRDDDMRMIDAALAKVSA